MDEKQLFIEAEYCIDKYFDEHLKSRLDSIMTMREGIRLETMATGFGVRNALLPSEDYVTHVTLSFPANDIEKLWSEVERNSNDLDIIAAAWRTAAVAKLGQQRYDELSSELGNDLAKAYVGHRMTMRMVDYEVDKHPIKGSVDYLLGDAHRSSVLSYLSPSTSGLQQYIDKKIVEKYNPSLLEKGTGKVLGSLTDVVVTAPVSIPLFHVTSWAALSKFVGVDVGVGFVGNAMQNAAFARNDVSKIISSAVFGGNNDELASFRRQVSSVNPYSSELVNAANEQLGKKIIRRSSTNPFLLDRESVLVGSVGVNFPKLPELPDYASLLRDQGEMYFAMREKQGDSGTGESQSGQQAVAASQIQEQLAEANKKRAMSGWGSMLDTLGLSGFGSVGKNLGYVLAMLPDLLIGMFTGKSRHLKIGDNLLPIGSIIAGMFVKNPLLKMLLIGFGGASLLNKAGQEALEIRDGGKQPVRQYREYGDEMLDVRIKQPVMRGNTLIATIDNVPSVITINDEAVDAYEKGKLPLHTLANAVLRKFDEQKEALEENYDRQMSQENTVERSRGLK